MTLAYPERGPIDDKLIYNLFRAVNDLTTKVSTATFNYTTIDTPEAARQEIQTSQAKIYTTTVRVLSNEYVAKDTTKTWAVDLPPGYKYTPGVSATAMNLGTSQTGNDVIVTITDRTKYRITGTAKFTSAGTASFGVAVMAIGIPE